MSAPKQTLINSTLSTVFWSTADKLGGQLGYLIATIYIASVIGPAAFGLVSLVSVLIILIDTLINTAVCQAVVQRAGRVTQVQLSTVFFANILLASSVYLVVYASGPAIAAFFREAELVEVSRVLGLVLFPGALTVVHRARLQSALKFREIAIATAMATVVAFSIAAYLAHAGLGHWALVWLIILRAGALALGICAFSRWTPSLHFSFASIQGILRHWANLLVAGSIGALSNAVQMILVGRQLGPVSTGYFNQASTITSQLAGSLASVLQTSTFPILASLQENKREFNQLLRETMRYAMMASFPCLLGLAAIADSLVELCLGPEWRPMIKPMQILCIARAATPMSVINLNSLNAAGRSDLSLRAEIIKLPITIGALIVAIPYGLAAVCLAILLSTFVSFFINAHAPGKLFELGALTQLRLGRNYIVASILLFVAVSNIQIEALWLDIVLSIFAGAVLYVTLLVIARDPGLAAIFKHAKARMSATS